LRKKGKRKASKTAILLNQIYSVVAATLVQSNELDGSFKEVPDVSNELDGYSKEKVPDIGQHVGFVLNIRLSFVLNFRLS
jgi:hypothetical protein